MSLYFSAYWGEKYKVTEGTIWPYTDTATDYTVEVRTRAALKRYDPHIVALLDEVHSCGNVIKGRCPWIRGNASVC